MHRTLAQATYSNAFCFHKQTDSFDEFFPCPYRCHILLLLQFQRRLCHIYTNPRLKTLHLCEDFNRGLVLRLPLSKFYFSFPVSSRLPFAKISNRRIAIRIENTQKHSVSTPAIDHDMMLYISQRTETGKLQSRIWRGFCILKAIVERLMAQIGNIDIGFSHVIIPKIANPAIKATVQKYFFFSPVFAKTMLRGTSRKFIPEPVHAPNIRKCIANIAPLHACIQRMFRFLFC